MHYAILKIANSPNAKFCSKTLAALLYALKIKRDFIAPPTLDLNRLILTHVPYS